ncbi:MAG: GNAT family N-acetyltransferase [Candidatus Hermodarchaeia archaeon]
MSIRLQWGLPDYLRLPAATLIYDTFIKKFRYTLGPREKGIRFIANSFQPKYGLVALSDGEFVGLAGAKTGEGELIEVKFSRWARTYHLHTIRSFLIGFPFWLEKRTPGVLTVTNISVKETARGKGIGTKIIQEFLRYGTAQGYRAVNLEVINSNVRAKTLYERMGFRITGYSSIPIPWSHLLGFTGVYEMTYPLV